MAGKAPSGHNHDGRYLLLSGGTITGDLIANKVSIIAPYFGSTADSDIHNKLQIRPYTGTPTDKMKNIFLQAVYDGSESYVSVGIDGLGSVGVGVAKWANATSWSGITGKPSTYPPSSHNHDDRYYTESEINTKLAGKSDSGHTHKYLPLSGGKMTGSLQMGMQPIAINAGHIVSTANQQMYFAASTESAYQLFFGVSSSKWTLCPMTDTYLTLGTPSKRWGQIYSNAGTISTSDRNLKKDISPISDQYLQFFALLQPAAYRFIDGQSGRIHVGFIAQDVEAAMEQAGLTDLDFAGFCKDIKQREIITKRTRHMQDADGNLLVDDEGNPLMEEYEDITYEDELDADGNPVYIYSLRYEEFIALNTAVIQHQQSKIEALEERVAKLERLVQA